MLSVAIPKGSLEAQTLRLLKQADLEVKVTSREYSPRIDDPRVGKVKILRPQEIPEFVEQGYFDLGITGKDWVEERGAEVVEVADLSYSKIAEKEGSVKIVLAVQEDRADDRGGKEIKSAKDLPPQSKISTEYPNLTKSFFDQLGIPVQIFFSYGATEAKDMMDGIVELTETGETLQKNNWRIIETILESSTKLIANKNSWHGDAEKRREIEEIRTLLSGVVEARGKVLLTMNVAEGRLREVVSVLPAMKKPTVSKLYEQGQEQNYYAVETVVSKGEVNILIPKLKSRGAEDIVEINITKIVR
ncbi:MAG: ATP phosphoribosyltransferase [Candidatus Methanophagaceae archaeon]|nr:MAG: ATP phosphoribosyltransferase [Methanophagales archaeon]HDN68512.1 ATP phosphoribosyltransferase [Methanomicrobia archaeon]